MIFFNKIKNIFIPVPPSSGSTFINECESIRGWAITLVFFFHLIGSIYGYSATAKTNIMHSFIISWNMGVTLFFVLSGYLLSRPFWEGRTPKLYIFYRNRFLRIMPLYTICVLAGAYLNSNFSQGLKAIIFLDLKISSLWPFSPVWWSLAVEVQFYLILPLVMFTIYKIRQLSFPMFIRYLILLIIISALLFIYWKISRPEIYGSYKYTSLDPKVNLLGRWPNFFCGMLLSMIQVRHGSKLKQYFTTTLFHKFHTGDILMILIITFIFLFNVHIVRTYSILRHALYFHHYAIEGILFTLILFILFNFNLGMRNILINPFMNFLGVISYSIFLLHVPVMNYTVFKFTIFHPEILRENTTAMLLSSSKCIVLTILFSMLTYALIERPFLKFKARSR